MERFLSRAVVVLAVAVLAIGVGSLWPDARMQVQAVAPATLCQATVVAAQQAAVPNIPPGVILIWAGNHADIPAGWTRETSLDDKYPKAWGLQNPNQTGGALTHAHSAGSHSHSMVAHNHSYTLASDSSPDNHFFNFDGSGIQPHTHNGTTSSVSGGSLQSQTVNWSSAGNDPLNYKVIFIKPDSVPATIQPGMIGFCGGSQVPSGYLYCNGFNGTVDLRDRYIRGATTGENAGIGAGQNNHNHTITHTHTANAHSHSGNSNGNNGVGVVRGGGGGYICTTNGHTHPVTLNNATATVNNYTNSTAGSGDTVEPAYKKLGLIQCQTSTTPLGLVGLWLGSTSSIPANWALCDGQNGTIDLRDKFIKCGNSLTDNGATGGSNTHTHATISHSHTSIGHTHSGSAGVSGSGPQQAWTDGGPYSHYQHTHAVTSVSSVDATFSNADITADSVNNEPAYRTVVYIQCVNVVPNAPMNLQCEGQTNPTGLLTQTPKFSWTFTDPDAGNTQSAYQILVGTTSADGSAWDSGKVDSSASSDITCGTALPWGTTYKWKVRVWDNFDFASDYAVEQTFSLQGAPTAFNLIAPANDASVGDPLLTFEWSASSDPESQPISYTLQISSDAGFTEPVYRTVGGLAATTFTPSPGAELANGGYYWRVIASDGDIQIYSNQSWFFTVDTVPPSAPVLTGLQQTLETLKINRIYGSADPANTLEIHHRPPGAVGYTVLPGSVAWVSNNFTFDPAVDLDAGSALFAASTDGADNTAVSDTFIYPGLLKNVFQDPGMSQSGSGSSMRLERSTSHDLKVAVNAGQQVTISAWLRRNAEYNGDVPRIRLSGLGIAGTGLATAAMQGLAEHWEQLTVSGMPNAAGVLTLTVQTSSTAAGSAAWIDDISVSQ